MGREIQTKRGNEEDGVNVFVGAHRKHASSPRTRIFRYHGVDRVFDVQEGVGTILGVAQRPLSVGCRVVEV